VTVPLNSCFAAGLFDGPWVVLVLIIASALINWLSKRREGKQANGETDGDQPKAPSGKPAVEFDLEEAMRRLLGEETPAPTPAPPPLPRESRSAPPPAKLRTEATPGKVPPVVPPLISPARAVARTRAVASPKVERHEQAARRFEELNEQGRHPATVIRHGRGSRSFPARRAAARWGDPRSARQAFVASLVFAPPKGLES
jgi:hypothetical protein